MRREFWISVNALLVAFHLAALGLVVTGQWGNPVVWLWLAVLALHLLEWPLAARAMQGRRVSQATIAIRTLLFGFTWWLPKSRGWYAPTRIA